MTFVESELRKLSEELELGLAPPTAWYTDPAITALEMERIFCRSWQYVGRREQLARTGDYFTGAVGDIPVVVVRAAEGIQVLVNVCRHRRHEVVRGTGNRRSLQCAYHAWTYDLNGALTTAPRSEREPHFRSNDYPLLRLQAATWGPWIFANADPSAPPFSEVLGELPRIVADCGIDLDSLQLRRREDWICDANWKVMLENFLECYHCSVQHPGFSAMVDVRPEAYERRAHRWFSTQRAPIRIAPSRQEQPPIREAQYDFFWPNLTLTINPGEPNLLLDVWLPDGPGRTHGFSEHYFGPNVSVKCADHMIAFNAQVRAEDRLLINSVQRNLRCSLPERGRFLIDEEQLCIHFHKLALGALNRQTHG